MCARACVWKYLTYNSMANLYGTQIWNLMVTTSELLKNYLTKKIYGVKAVVEIWMSIIPILHRIHLHSMGVHVHARTHTIKCQDQYLMPIVKLQPLGCLLSMCSFIFGNWYSQYTQTFFNNWVLMWCRGKYSQMCSIHI